MSQEAGSVEFRRGTSALSRYSPGAGTHAQQSSGLDVCDPDHSVDRLWEDGPQEPKTSLWKQFAHQI